MYVVLCSVYTYVWWSGLSSFWYDFILVPYWSSMLFCLHVWYYLLKFHSTISSSISDHNFCSSMKSSQTFHRYHVKEVQAHSYMTYIELGRWMGLDDQLTLVCNPPMFYHCNYSRMRTLCDTEWNTVWIVCPKWNMQDYMYIVFQYRHVASQFLLVSPRDHFVCTVPQFSEMKEIG